MGFINAAILAFTYRLRGGGFFSLGSTAIARLVWSASLMLAFLDMRDYQWLVLWVMIGAYISMLIPHAYCQNMGNWPTPQKGWPSFFFPAWTATGWSQAPLWERALYDAGQMGCVALLRGITVFAPFALMGDYAHAWHAVMCITFLQPVGYLIGVYAMPVTLPSLTKFSTEWGEAFNGAAWAAAVAVYMAS